MAVTKFQEGQLSTHISAHPREFVFLICWSRWLFSQGSPHFRSEKTETNWLPLRTLLICRIVQRTFWNFDIDPGLFGFKSEVWWFCTTSTGLNWNCVFQNPVYCVTPGQSWLKEKVTWDWEVGRDCSEGRPGLISPLVSGLHPDCWSGSPPVIQAHGQARYRGQAYHVLDSLPVPFGDPPWQPSGGLLVTSLWSPTPLQIPASPAFSAIL